MSRRSIVKKIVLTMFTMVGLLIWAAPVSQNDAQLAAANWMFDQNVFPAAGGVSSVDTFCLAGTNVAHLVRFQNGGTIVTSTDDQLEPILAYVNSELDAVEADSPLAALLLADRRSRIHAIEVEEEVSYGPRLQLAAAGPSQMSLAASNRKKWRSLLEYDMLPSAICFAATGMSSISTIKVNPLIESTWNQGSVGGDYCYNYYTPNHAVCGCVATAMAQIMRYHKFPQTSVAARERECTVEGEKKMLKMMGGIYDWSQMPLKPSSPTTAQRQTIGKLTYDCGVAVKMKYTLGSSAAAMQDLRSAFSEVFGYVEAQYKVVHDDLTSFFNIVQSELAEKHPVAISISGTGCHCVVVDGYGVQSDVDYYHLNMGWGGKYDLWYNLPNVNSTKENNYNVINEVVYGIRPPSRDVSDSLSEGVDNFDLHFTTGGDANWYLQTSTTHDGVDALRTGKIGNSKSTWLQTEVDGSGILTFWWKCDTGNALWGSDDFMFQLDGKTKSTIYGSESWTKKTYRIEGAGKHVLKWIYVKDSSGGVLSRADCGWLDEVTWTPMATVTLDANGGTVSSNELFLAKGKQYYGALPEPTRAGFTFQGWYTAPQGGTKITSTHILTDDILLTAHWLPNKTALYDWDSWMRFSTWGAQPWYNVEESSAKDGRWWAFRSGAIGHQEESSLGLSVEGAGILSFYQRISSEKGCDKLSLTIDDVQMYSISGITNTWNYYSKVLETGTHEIIWTYTKDKAKVGGSDSAWLDCIEWYPRLSITLDANGGNFGLFQKTYGTTGYERMGCHLVSVRVPERGGYIFNGWFSDPVGGQMITGDKLLTRDLTHWYAHWTKKMDLNDALDTGLKIVTGGDSPWFGQNEQTFDAIDAAQSGFISGAGESWLEVVTEGAGYLSFKWAVDGGYSYDGSADNDVLSYWRDGYKVNSVEGMRDWESCGSRLLEGVHTNLWKFVKHSSDPLVNRRAWLDQLEWHPQMQISFRESLAENENLVQTITGYEGFPIEWWSVPVLTRENHIFQGWYSAPYGGERLTDGAVYDRKKSNWYAHLVPDVGMIEKFAGAGIVEYGGQGWKVTLTNEVDGVIEIPDNLGKMTLDLAGRHLQGEDGAAGNETMRGGDGLPAIRIIPCGGDGEPTELTIVNTGKEGGVVAGGDGGVGCPPGNGAAAISVVGEARDGVIINIGKDVKVFGGNGGENASGIGDRGKGAVSIDGNIGSNSGTIFQAEVLWPNDASSMFDAAKTYEGVVIDQYQNLKGTIQVKSTKSAINARTGRRVSKITASVDDYATRKWSFKGESCADKTILTCTAADVPVSSLSIALGVNGIWGTWGDLFIVGARVVESSRTGLIRGLVERSYVGQWNVLLANDERCCGMALSVAANGSVNVKGKWQDGEMFSAKSKLAVGAQYAIIAVSVTPTKTRRGLRCLVRIGDDGSVSADQVVYFDRLDKSGVWPEPQPLSRVSGGVAVVPVFRDQQLHEVIYAGVTYTNRLNVQEQAHPVMYSVSGLPMGLKLDTATGIISGVPTSKIDKQFVSTLKVTSLVNSKLTSKIQVIFDVKALPEWARGTFDGGIENGVGNVTISTSGKLSGKIRSLYGDWTLKGEAFSTADPYSMTVEMKAADRVMTNMLVCAQMSAMGDSEQVGFLVLDCPDSGTSVKIEQNLWKVEPYKSMWVKYRQTWPKMFSLTSAEVPDLNSADYIEMKANASGTFQLVGYFDSGILDAKGRIVYQKVSGSAVFPIHEAEPVSIYFAPTKNWPGFSTSVYLPR